MVYFDVDDDLWFEIFDKVDKKVCDIGYLRQICVIELYEQGIFGDGVIVVVLDIGIWVKGGGDKWLFQGCVDCGDCVFVVYDVIEDQVVDLKVFKDYNGYGSYVVSIISLCCCIDDVLGGYNGVVLGVDLVVLCVFDEDGCGIYFDVICVIQFVVDYCELLNVWVLNFLIFVELCFYYWEDFLNQVVMVVWQVGIVVVVFVGNCGLDLMIVGVLGNVFYVIIVGVMFDVVLWGEEGDDFIMSFFFMGLMFEGFVKLEIVVFGGYVFGFMDKKSLIFCEYKDFYDGNLYYYMFGILQVMVIVSVVVVLLLQMELSFFFDDVKCCLISIV